MVFSGAGANVCQGDSGGPLIYMVDGRPAIAGVVSEGSVQGCGPGDTTSYTNLTNPDVLAWVRSQVSSVGGL